MGKRKFRLSIRKNHERKKYEFKKKKKCEIKKKKKSKLVVSLPLDTIRVLPVHIPIDIYTSAATSDLHTLHTRLLKSNNGEWTLRYVGEKLMLSKHSQSLIWTIIVDQNMLCTITANENEIDVERFSQKLCSVNEVHMLLQYIDESHFCAGSPDTKFFEVRDHHGGVFKSCSGTETVAYYDTRLLPVPTIRHTKCQVILSNKCVRCKACDDYRSNLHSLASHHKKPVSADILAASSHVNYRYLTSSEKDLRLKSMHKKTQALKMKITRLKIKLMNEIETRGIVLDEEISADLKQVMEEKENDIAEQFPEDSFQYIFWTQQKQAFGKTGDQVKGIRWHPLVIKWCLYLRHQSSKAYDALRESRIISLPSQRTLRDFSHCIKAKSGFSVEVDDQLMKASNIASCPPYEKLVALLLDEMHIKEGLVFDKHAGRIIGFTDLGEINNHLATFQKMIEDTDNTSPILANSVLVIMVKCLFSKLQFPFAQFPCLSIVGEQLFNPFWEAVFHLERMGFKVLATTFDGASSNRRFVAIHNPDLLVYKLRNIYAAEERYIYIFSDVPHLMKTTRNCLFSKQRNLWNNGENISSQHIIDLYQKDNGKAASGLSLVPKLTYEHLFLTSFSKMRVDLAVQVLSETVAKALQLIGGAETEGTSQFIMMFDKFFDIFNVNNFSNWARRRKPFLYPYRNADDKRLNWLKDEFLVYLNKWEESVHARSGYTVSEKRKMLLSPETLLGIRRTVKSFLEFLPFLFDLPEVKQNRVAFLSVNLNQDSLEKYFGCQRQRGGTSDNPTVSDFYSNTEALRVINSFCRNPVRGNCQGNTTLNNSTTDIDITPLPKRKRFKSS